MKRVLLVVVCMIVMTLPALAQMPAQGAAATTDPFSKALKASFDTVSGYLVKSAAKMPEENFSFKPTPEVRSFGEILGHVANAQFSYCSRVKGEKNPNQGNDFEKKTTKADLVKAITDSNAYCSAAYDTMTDAQALQPVVATPPPAPAPGAQAKPAPPPAMKLRFLLGNVTHDQEHYGNLVTYLRLKGLVPPSSEPSK
jgi:uncharacterized damage-inducible protein DinB